MAAIVIRDTVHLRGRLIVASPSGENKFLHFLPIHNVLEMTIRYTAGVRMAEFTTSIWYTVYDNCFSLFATYCLKKMAYLYTRTWMAYALWKSNMRDSHYNYYTISSCTNFRIVHALLCNPGLGNAVVRFKLFACPRNPCTARMPE